jgi:beta-lactamase regulating signal transducer with metallopeptidase domain
MSISSHSAADSEKLPGLLGAWIGKIIFALVVAVVLVCVIYVLSGSRLFASSGVALPLVSLFVEALFALAPLLACFAHTISIDRQKEKLDGLVLSKIKETQYFVIAKASLASIRPASVKELDFVVPMLFFAVIIVFCSLISFMALFYRRI